MSHGRKDKGEVIFVAAKGIELLEPGEIAAAFGNVRRGVPIQLVNEACYAGMWEEVAAKTSGKDTLVELRPQPRHDRSSSNHRSASGQLQRTESTLKRDPGSSDHSKAAYLGE